MRDPFSHWTFGDTLALAVILWSPLILAGLLAAQFVISFDFFN